MAEFSLHDFRLFLNRLSCRLFPIEQQKRHILHAFHYCADAFNHPFVLGSGQSAQAGSLRQYNRGKGIQSMRKCNMRLVDLPGCPLVLWWTSNQQHNQKLPCGCCLSLI